MLLPKHNRHRLFKNLPHRGFSLVEILVVITIIGILSGLSLGFVGIIQKNTRDAQRESDLRVLQSALQQYYADHQKFPGDNQVIFGSPLKSFDASKTYLKTIPKDPLSGQSYCYDSKTSISSSSIQGDCASDSGTCHYYLLCATLENPGSSSTACTCDSDSGYNFQVTPL